MKSINTSALLALANAQVAQRAQDFGALPMDIQEAMREAEDKRKKQVAEAAADEIMSLLANKDALLVTNSGLISSLEKQIEGVRSVMTQLQRATDYGMATRNFLPLSKLTGNIPAGADTDLCKVPKDWTAPVAAPEAATAAA
jgi:hypothetical protein